VNIVNCDYVGCVKDSDGCRRMRTLSLVPLVALLLTTYWVDRSDTIRWL